MKNTSATPIYRTRSGRALSWVFLILVLTSPTTNASRKDGRQVGYIAGTFTEIHLGCKGTLDARDPKELLIKCGGERLEIPTSAIVLCQIVESQQDARDLGLTGTTITNRKGQKLVYIRTLADMSSSNWILLELPANYARDLVVYLIRMKEDRDSRVGNKLE